MATYRPDSFFARSVGKCSHRIISAMNRYFLIKSAIRLIKQAGCESACLSGRQCFSLIRSEGPALPSPRTPGCGIGFRPEHSLPVLMLVRTLGL